jgi:hypothetical protein
MKGCGRQGLGDRAMAGMAIGTRMKSSNSHPETDRKERTMDAQIRHQQVEFHQQQLRNEAAAERLARGNQDRFSSPVPTARVPRTLGALRRLVGTSFA